ncbi:hypothetical protein V2O64_22110 [Verrucomicrobiaceae bacterium 227]
MSDRRKQLIILWEGASWADLHPLMDAGRMPHLEALTTAGAMGKVQGVRPAGVGGIVSLATGQAPCDHGVFHDLKASSPHLPGREITREDWLPVWDQLAARGDRSIEVGWPLTHPASDHLTASVSDRFSWPARTRQYRFCLPKDSVVVPEQLEEVLRECRVVSSELGLDFLKGFLGVSDEDDLPDENRLARLRVALASIQSVQAAALVLIEELEWDVCALGFDGLRRLFEVSCRHEMPFAEKDRFYELLDGMLGELIETAPADVVVHLVSPSSFRMGRGERCFPSNEGIWVMSGPGVKPDELIHGGHVLEIAPTIWALRGEAIDAGMARSARVDLLREIPLPEVREDVESHSMKAGERVLPWDRLLVDGRTLHVATPRQLQDPKLAAGLFYDRHLGEFQSLIEMGERGRALRKGAELLKMFPGDFRMGLGYAGCLVEQREWQALRELLVKLQEIPHSRLQAVEMELIACALLAQERKDGALAARLATLGKEHHLQSDQWIKVAAFYRRMQNYEQAQVIYRGLTKRDPSWTLPWLMMAETLVLQGNLSDAETVGRHVISLNSSLEKGHLVLAKTLYRLDRKQEAADVLGRDHGSGKGSRGWRRMARFYEQAAQ